MCLSKTTLKVWNLWKNDSFRHNLQIVSKNKEILYFNTKYNLFNKMECSKIIYFLKRLDEWILFSLLIKHLYLLQNVLSLQPYFERLLLSGRLELSDEIIVAWWKSGAATIYRTASWVIDSSSWSRTLCRWWN